MSRIIDILSEEGRALIRQRDSLIEIVLLTELERLEALLKQRESGESCS